ncbi:MAG: TolC family protein, partial [Lentisphaeraceae bacterium]|nr:TolC family protein [Lentisphaeraceae bacterium]
LLASNETISATDGAIGEAKARFSPRVDLELTANESENLSGSRANEDHYSAMVILSYKIFRGGSDRAALSSQFLLKNQQSAEKQELELAILRDLAVAWHARAGKLVELKYFAQHMISTEKTLKAYKTQYNLGQRTLFDLLNTRSEFFRSKSTFIDTKYTNMLSVYQVMANIGVLREQLLGSN